MKPLPGHFYYVETKKGNRCPAIHQWDADTKSYIFYNRGLGHYVEVREVLFEIHPLTQAPFIQPGEIWDVMYAGDSFTLAVVADSHTNIPRAIDFENLKSYSPGDLSHFTQWVKR
jgi:hypothetical protein